MSTDHPTGHTAHTADDGTWHAPSAGLTDATVEDASSGLASLAPTWSGDGDLRFLDLGPVGRGGMGEVRRVHDTDLDRTCVRKELRADRSDHPVLLQRFLTEARITAQLAHPGIVPVHDVGRLPDGRPYYLMREVRGETLSRAIGTAHGRHWSTEAHTPRSLVGALQRACEAVAYAHSRGVIHRDLKPDNIMLGEFGTVMVLDWGIARLTHSPDLPPHQGTVAGRLTHAGRTMGTPGYLPPEQARGDLAALGPASDVFSLCAILFEIVSGHAPYRGPAADRIAAVLDGPPPRPVPPDTLDDDLVDICMQGLAPLPADRPPTAAALNSALSDWLSGMRRRERALERVAEATEHLQARDHALTSAARHRADASAILEPLPPHAPEADKRPGWALEDAAAALEADARLAGTRFIQALQAALQTDPTLDEAHAHLARWHHARHREAEQRGDPTAAAAHEALLRAHDRGTFADYLAGSGMVRLHTLPRAHTVEVRRFEHQHRARVAVPHTTWRGGWTTGRALPAGSYLLIARTPDAPPTHIPVRVERGGTWSTAPIPLAPPSLPPDDCYVPAGPFLSGGDPESADGLPARTVTLDGFFIRRHPVTNTEYIAFLNALVDAGADAERYLPQSFRTADQARQRGFGRTPDGHFTLDVDGTDERWEPDGPVVSVDWHSACAYARWCAQRDGLPWRLPHALEWEKAARGVDGRTLPWGDFLEPTRAHILGSVPGRPRPTSVHAAPADVSVYGVRGLVGNVRDWCASLYRRDGAVLEEGRLVLDPLGAERTPDAPPPADAIRDIRGGAAWNNRALVRPATRFGGKGTLGVDGVGFRLARSVVTPSER